MGTIKDRNGMDLTEAEDIKKRWQEYTEELYKKDLHDPHNHNGVITHLEPDILECKVKWALGNITMNKASGGDEIPVELFHFFFFFFAVQEEVALFNVPQRHRWFGFPNKEWLSEGWGTEPGVRVSFLQH